LIAQTPGELINKAHSNNFEKKIDATRYSKKIKSAKSVIKGKHPFHNNFP
jgi:hypothetical protein